MTRRLQQTPNRFGARDDRHACPGCGVPVPRAQLACRADWRRLPAAMRAEVTAAYAEQPSGGRHVAAVADAAQWLRANRPGLPSAVMPDQE